MANELSQKFRNLAKEISLQLGLYAFTNEDFLQFYNFYCYLKDNNILTYNELISLANSLIKSNILITNPNLNLNIAELKDNLSNDIEDFAYRLNNLPKLQLN